jgi:hypothetical protein
MVPYCRRWALRDTKAYSRPFRDMTKLFQNNVLALLPI